MPATGTLPVAARVAALESVPRGSTDDAIAALHARLNKVEDGHDLFVDQNASLRGALDRIRGLGKEFEKFDSTSDKIARSRIRPRPDQAPTTPDPGT
jgi:hypothetical protein